MKLGRARLSLIALLAVVVSVSSVSAATPGKITKEKFNFDGRPVSYYLFVPKSVSAQAPAPVIVLLHGSGRNGSSLAEPWKAAVIKGHDHNYYSMSAQVNASAWAFLRGRSLDTDPKYIDRPIR